MAVNVQKLRSDFSRLEKKRDSLMEARDFNGLRVCLDEIDEIKKLLAIHDPDSPFAHALRLEKAKNIFKKS